MKIKTDEITSVIKQEIDQFTSELEISEVGQVVEVGDGIARIYGLSGCMAGELLEFETSRGAVMGQAMNLEEDTVGAIIYGDYLAVEEGNTVVFLSSELEEFIGLCPKVIVFRNGTVFDIFENEKVNADTLLKGMFGQTAGIKETYITSKSNNTNIPSSESSRSSDNTIKSSQKIIKVVDFDKENNSEDKNNKIKIKRF